MTKAKNWKPEGQSSVTPHLILKDADKAIEFYKKALGAEEVCRMKTPDGKIMHASIKIDGCHIYLCDEMDGECGSKSAATLGGANATIHLYVPDADAAFKRAVDAGAKPTMPVQDMFWGSRYGMVVDPFGQPWSFATCVEEVSPEEAEKRGKEMFKQMAAAK
ncbi:MAG TPA: VOC family protein [Planktothrix sp.]|jgi:PhnB protein